MQNTIYLNEPEANPIKGNLVSKECYSLLIINVLIIYYIDYNNLKIWLFTYN